MASINDTPQGSTLFPEGLVNMSMERRQQVILQAAQVIAESFVDINFSKKDSFCCHFREQRLKCLLNCYRLFCK